MIFFTLDGLLTFLHLTQYFNLFKDAVTFDAYSLSVSYMLNIHLDIDIYYFINTAHTK